MRMPGMIWASITDDITPHLQAVRESTEAVAEQMVRDAADVLSPTLRQQAPMGHHFSFSGDSLPGGTLRDSLRWAHGTMGASLLGAFYGLFVIGGTMPHEIKPSAAPALAFYWERMGQSVVRASVNHPGQMPWDFRLKALDQAFSDESLQHVWDSGLQQWASGGGGGGG